MESGRCPAEEFLDSLPSRQAQKVAWIMQLVEELEIVPAQYFKKLRDTNGLWEIRVQVATDIYRFLGSLTKQINSLSIMRTRKNAEKLPNMKSILLKPVEKNIQIGNLNNERYPSIY
jgi:Phage derived protein Gp49-like (DUF891).